MRKLLVVTALIFSSLITLSAQTQRDSDLRFAFVLSPQISWIKSDHNAVSSNGSLFGYNFGVVMDKFFATNYAISTGLTINTTGGQLSYRDGGEFTIGGETNVELDKTSIEYRLKYIEIPLSLKLQTNDQQRTSFYGVFGLAGNINIKTNNGSGKSLNDEVRSLFASYHFGGGVQYSIGGNSYLNMGIKYNQGINDITKNKGYSDNAILNRLVFQFGIIF